MLTIKLLDTIQQELLSDPRTKRSAWSRGVNLYACHILDTAREAITYRQDNHMEPVQEFTEQLVLNGADNWNHYAWSGNGLVYDHAIAETLCTPSELKKKDFGRLQPNQHEDWLDVEARALYQAFGRIKRKYRKHLQEMEEQEQGRA